MRRRPLAFLAALLFLLPSCGPAALAPTVMPTPTATASPIATAAAPFPTTVTDFQGRAVAIAAGPKRIISIGPSNTEFLFALGAGDRVVGRDDFSDTPAAAQQVEKVGGVKVSIEKIVSLRPDLVVSVKLSDGTIEKIAGAGIPVLVVDPQGLGDVARTAILLGQAIGADGGALASSIDARLAALKQKVAAATTRPRVFHEVDASDPSKPFTVGPGSYIDDLIGLAGGRNIAANAGSAYPQISFEEVVRADPEVIVLGDADYGTTAEQVAARAGWSAISAVKDRKIFPIPDSLVSRPGPRVADAAEAYARILHPELFR